MQLGIFTSIFFFTEQESLASWMSLPTSEKNVAITVFFVTIFKNTDGFVWLYGDLLYYMKVKRNIDTRNIFTPIYLLNQ